MLIYPAIDIMNGYCVRLYKGDFEQSTVYGDDPLAMAQRFEEEGAHWLHLVDLDGARNPHKRQVDLIKEIAAHTKLKIQTGGGIRSAEDVEALLEVGVRRVVIGSLAVREPIPAKRILKTFGPEKICMAFDVMPAAPGLYSVAAEGWREDSGTLLHDVITPYAEAGLKHVLCTDISRDGTLGGVNTMLYRTLSCMFHDLHFQASGGVAGLDDLRHLKEAGARGVIIGKALYEGTFTLGEALSLC